MSIFHCIPVVIRVPFCEVSEIMGRNNVDGENGDKWGENDSEKSTTAHSVGIREGDSKHEERKGILLSAM